MLDGTFLLQKSEGATIYHTKLHHIQASGAHKTVLSESYEVRINFETLTTILKIIKHVYSDNKDEKKCYFCSLLKQCYSIWNVKHNPQRIEI